MERIAWSLALLATLVASGLAVAWVRFGTPDYPVAIDVDFPLRYWQVALGVAALWLIVLWTEGLHSLERLAWAQEVLAKSGGPPPHRWTPIYAREALHLSQYPQTVMMPLQALRIGNLGIAAIPCEVFAETGLAIHTAATTVVLCVDLLRPTGIAGTARSRI